MVCIDKKEVFFGSFVDFFVVIRKVYEKYLIKEVFRYVSDEGNFI